MKELHALLLAMALSVAFADAQPFSRYESIIERKPFGPEPVNFDPEATPGGATPGSAGEAGEITPEQRSAEEQQLASSVRVSILNVTPTGAVKVGFTDSAVNPPENYYLVVGGSQNGWTVKGADPAAESVTLEKGGVEVTVKLGESTGGKGGARKPGGPQHLQRAVGRRTFDAGGGEVGHRLGGVAKLRQLRMENAAKEREEAERRREAEAVAKAEQAEREALEAAEKQRLAEERAQQREALLQIQEQLRKQREEREAERRSSQEQGGNNEASDT